MEKESSYTKWIVSIMEIENGGKKYKVTRRIPDLGVSETRIYKSKKLAKRKFNEWLN